MALNVLYALMRMRAFDPKPTFVRQRQERIDLDRTHDSGVAFAVVEDETLDSMGVGFFGTAAVVLGADFCPHLIQ